LGVYTARPATLCIALTLLLGAGATLDRATLTSAHAGTVGGRDSGLSELDMALVRLDDAILSFLEEAGCYPAALEDLTVTVPPEVGLDSSGNAVPVGRDWLGSRIKELPIDPLTGRNDTWVYEVTGSPMIDSGGLDIAMACEPTVDRDRAAELAAEATVSYPFDEAHVGAAGFGDIVPLARMDIETSPGGVTIADATEGNAATLTLRRKGDAGVVTACLSPDNRRVAFARHYGSGFTIAACDLLYDGLGADTPPLIGNNHRRLLARPWYDVGYIQRMAWDPTGEHLAIAGSRDQPDGYVAVLFLLEPGAMPREIAAEEGDEWIDELHWAPDGRSIYMIERLERLPDRSGYAKKRLPVMASQYSLDGELMERQQTFRSCLAASEHGVAFAAPDAQTIIYRPREGEERRLVKMTAPRGLLDLLPTERGVLAVYDHEAEPRGAVIFLHGTSGGPAEMIAQAPLPRDDDWSRPRLLGWQDGAVVFSVGMTPSGPLQVGEDPGVYIARRGQSAPQHIRLDLPGRGSRHYDEFPVAVTWE
ncbi:MAG TPA: hypothetical protein DEP45_03780, partial [Armatimonadetes bacterium]|nr:hypothetical protein [Armatimonadota bacterium]